MEITKKQLIDFFSRYSKRKMLEILDFKWYECEHYYNAEGPFSSGCLKSSLSLCPCDHFNLKNSFIKKYGFNLTMKEARSNG